MLKKKIHEIARMPKDKFEKDIDRLVRRLKKEAKLGVRWLFFYTYKDKMDAMLHVCDVIALAFIAWRVFGR